MQASIVDFLVRQTEQQRQVSRLGEQEQNKLVRLLRRMFKSIEHEFPGLEVRYSTPKIISAKDFEDVSIKVHYYPELLFKADGVYRDYAPLEATVTVWREGKKYTVLVSPNCYLTSLSDTFAGRNLQALLEKAREKLVELIKYGQSVESKPLRDKNGHIIARTDLIRSGGAFDFKYLLSLKDDLLVNFVKASPLKLNEIPNHEFELDFQGEKLLVQINPQTYENYLKLRPALELLQNSKDKHYHLEMTPAGGKVSAWYPFVDERGVMHPFISAVFKFTMEKGEEPKGWFTYYQKGRFHTRELSVSDLSDEEFRKMFRKYNEGFVIDDDVVRALRAGLRSTMEALAIELKRQKYRPRVQKGRKEMVIDFKNKKGTRIELFIDFKEIEFKLFVNGSYKRTVRWDATMVEAEQWAMNAESLLEYLVNL